MSSRYYDTSLWDYKPGEFRQLINVITPKSTLVSEILARFRELPVLPRKFKEMIVGEVSADPKLILELLNIRTGMPPESKFNLGCKLKYREQQLIDSLAESYEIDKEKAKAKVVLGIYDNRPTQYFTYALEVVIAPRTDLSDYHAGEVEIIDCVNDDASSDGGGTYFNGSKYAWYDRKRYDLFGIEKELKSLYALSIRGILAECGFNTSDRFSRRRKPCVILINLKCRVIEWLGAKGKTQINVKPFEDDIAETVSKLAYKMPSYHGEGYGASYTSEEPKEEKQTAIDYLRDFLWYRREKVEADPTLKTRDRLTQSGVFYRVRRIMIAEGFKPPKDWGTTRTTLQNSIMKTCQELWPDENITREQLGIVAAARATMLYDGQSYPVDIDSVERLANKGIAILVIEKEGIADVLAPYAEEYHIALVHTQGRLTEYGKDLIEEIKEIGSIVWTLTDYDATGIDISKKTRTPTPRIGITRDTVKWLQENDYDIEEADVEEEI